MTNKKEPRKIYPNDMFDRELKVGDIIIYGAPTRSPGVSFYEVLSFEESHPNQVYQTKEVVIRMKPRCRLVDKGPKPKGEGRILRYTDYSVIVTDSDLLALLKEKEYSV